MEQFTSVRVTYPLLNTDANGEQYYTYGINIKTNDPAFARSNSLTWRRYSEFSWLRKIIKDNTYNTRIQIPDLPTQGILRDRCCKEFLHERSVGLQKFMKGILEIPLCKSDKALHLFLQTSISTNDILQNIMGKRHDKIETEDNVPSLSIYECTRLNRKTKSPSKEVNGNKSLESKSPLNSPDGSLSRPIKKVTFCKQVHIVLLTKDSLKGIL